uniref:Transmembrane protein n=1 Tax=Macrostomum lignano TaxID=282301 RepID=A0A1I8I6C4_9PLAT
MENTESLTSYITDVAAVVLGVLAILVAFGLTLADHDSKKECNNDRSEASVARADSDDSEIKQPGSQNQLMSSCTSNRVHLYMRSQSNQPVWLRCLSWLMDCGAFVINDAENIMLPNTGKYNDKFALICRLC